MDLDQNTPIRTLVRLRWSAILFLALITLGVRFGLGAELPLLALSALLGFAALGNAVLPRLSRFDAEWVVAGVLLSDTLVLSAMLALSGGPANPFSVLYLILVTLAATMTRPLFTWIVVVVSSAGYAFTFAFNVPLPASLGGHHAMHHSAYGAHMQGMWVAYTLAAGAIALFVSRLSESLRREREERAKSARLLGLATLAAGAAHEIGNPLGTIRVAAGELLRELEAKGADQEQLDDLALINREIDRARGVLERMAIGAGELKGESPVPVEISDFLGRAVQPLGDATSRVSLDVPKSLPRVRWPVHATAQAFTQIFRNGLEASDPRVSISCSVRAAESGVAFEVRDAGQGMSREVLDRIGEPFFTTRPEGMGLGVFIARSLIEHLGGRFDVTSFEGKGTTVSVWLPLEVGR